MANDLLLEIGMEEMPAKLMPTTLGQLKQQAADKLAEQRLAYKEIVTLGTPRRLVLWVQQLAERQPDQTVESRGPSAKAAFDPQGKLTKAGAGFARAQGVAADELVVKHTANGDYVFAVKQDSGKPAIEVLPSLLEQLVTGLTFPKSMRWGSLDVRFARPLRWLLALFGAEVIPFEVATLRSGRITVGHRFLSTGRLSVNDPEHYFAVMKHNYVMVDPVKREQTIRQQIQKLAAEQNGVAAIDDDLMQEVVYLVEYPTALCGRFDTKYLKLPNECVITPMRDHQRYFPVFSRAGKLMNLFITVRNGNEQHLDMVQAGNERVLRARLADAEFFFAEDRKSKLEDKVDKLKTVVFQEGLGTLHDKSVRLQNVAGKLVDLASAKQGQLMSVLQRAAYLAKADLVTNMVREFTELQGIMGREYSLIDGENPGVSQAIYEQYLPRFAGDELPVSLAGCILSIADKLDNIVATFSRGLIPSGSQDPFALRRQALGVIHILTEQQLFLPLKQAIEEVIHLLPVNDGQRGALAGSVKDFINGRLKTVLSDQGFRYDVVDAVIAVQDDDVYDTLLRCRSLSQAITTKEFAATIQAFTRVMNIVKQQNPDVVQEQLLTDSSERQLYRTICDAQQKIQKLQKQRGYDLILQQLSELVQPINTFFDSVMVMVEDQSVKNNRLALLYMLRTMMLQLADLTKIVETEKF